MSAEGVLLSLLNAAFTVVGLIAAVKYVLPRIADVLDSAVEDKTAVDALVVLLEVFLIVTAASLVIGFLGGIHGKLNIYLSTIKPAIDMVTNLKVYVEWLVVGVGALLLVRTFRGGTGKKTSGY